MPKNSLLNIAQHFQRKMQAIFCGIQVHSLSFECSMTLDHVLQILNDMDTAVNTISLSFTFNLLGFAEAVHAQCFLEDE